MRALSSSPAVLGLILALGVTTACGDDSGADADAETGTTSADGESGTSTGDGDGDGDSAGDGDGESAGDGDGDGDGDACAGLDAAECSAMAECHAVNYYLIEQDGSSACISTTPQYVGCIVASECDDPAAAEYWCIGDDFVWTPGNCIDAELLGVELLGAGEMGCDPEPSSPLDNCE